MNWLIPSIIANSCAVLVLFFAYMFLYIIEKEKALGYWVLAWGIYFFRYIFQILFLLSNKSPYFFFANQSTVFISGILLLAGNFAFIQIKFPRYYYALTFIAIFWIGISSFFPFPFWLKTGPTFGILGLVYIQTGLLLIKHEGKTYNIALLVGILFILWGIHKIDYPFLYPVKWFAPIGYMLGALFELIIAISMILLYFIKARDNLDIVKDELDVSEQRYRILVETSPTGILLSNKEGKIIFANIRAEEIFGINQKDIINEQFQALSGKITDFDGNIISYEKNMLDDLLKIKNKIYGIQYILNRNDEKIFLSINFSPIYKTSGEFDGIVAIIEDITKQKEHEEKLGKIIVERETLLKEIHHRVKNNMQIITSLLSLQEQYIFDERDRELFEDSQRRVFSMALVHEKLYKSENFSQIHLKVYILELINEIQNSYLNDKIITLEYDLDDIYIDIEKAIPCALMINELVSNSFKHGFKDRKSGVIKVCFKVNNNKFIMSIADDGIGIGSDINLDKVNTFGLTLVKSLSRQIGAEMEIVRNNNTSFTFTFPVC